MDNVKQVYKKCTLCKIVKPINEFGKHSYAKDGKRAYCIECNNLFCRTKWYNPQVRRNINLKHRYGITEEQYNEMFANQNGRCAICYCAESLCVDHNHITGRIRGLLCQSCNKALGMFKEEIPTIQNAINYLTNWKNSA